MHVYHKSIEDSSYDAMLSIARSFTPPGKLVYLQPVKMDEDTGELQYEVKWIEAEDFMSKGLVISSRMALDHFPNEATDAIARALARREVGSWIAGEWLDEV